MAISEFGSIILHSTEKWSAIKTSEMKYVNNTSALWTFSSRVIVFFLQVCLSISCSYQGNQSSALDYLIKHVVVHHYYHQVKYQNLDWIMCMWYMYKYPLWYNQIPFFLEFSGIHVFHFHFLGVSTFVCPLGHEEHLLRGTNSNYIKVKTFSKICNYTKWLDFTN